MHTKKSLVFFCFLILSTFVILYIFYQGKKGDLVSKTLTQRQISAFQVLESTNFNTSPIQFKLHVQAHERDVPIPQKLILTGKDGTQKEFPLSRSSYTNECSSHESMTDTMQKWETEWFSFPDIQNADESYVPKLSSNYSIGVVYKEKDDDHLFLSVNPIENVCYQISKTIPMTPNKKEELEEKYLKD